MCKTTSNFQKILIPIISITISMATWSCKSSSSVSANKQNYINSTKTNHKPDDNKNRPLPAAAKLPVQKTLVTQARTWLGTPYQWGGQTKDGADCSGFVMELYKQAIGVKMPRNSRKQNEYCMPIPTEQLAVGDLLFFASPKSNGEIAHVGMYIGDNMMIHSSSSRGVIESDLGQKYYKQYFYGAGRIPMISQVIPIENISLPGEIDINKPGANIELAQNSNDYTPAIQAPAIENKITTTHTDVVQIIENKNSLKSNNTPDTPKTVSTDTPITVITVTEKPTVTLTDVTEPNKEKDLDPETIVFNAFAGRTK